MFYDPDKWRICTNADLECLANFKSKYFETFCILRRKICVKCVGVSEKKMVLLKRNDIEEVKWRKRCYVQHIVWKMLI